MVANSGLPPPFPLTPPDQLDKEAYMDWLLNLGAPSSGAPTHHTEVAGTLPGRGYVMLKGVRCLPSDFFTSTTKKTNEESDYENEGEGRENEEAEADEQTNARMTESMTSSASTMESSMTLSEDSNMTMTDEHFDSFDSASVSTAGNSTLRRRRSFQPKRNYRICDPNESQYWLQLHNEYNTASLRTSKATKLLRRWSVNDNRKEKSFSPSPRPVKFNTEVQTSEICQQMPESPSTQNNNTGDCNGESRLSFASSSTGYSSARSSLRSSEGTDDDHSDIVLFSPASSLSEARRRQLLSNGGLSRLQRISAELIDTERTYVNDLWQVIQGYLNYLVDVRESLDLTVDQVSSTFGCIERIFMINKKLYTQLDEAELDCVRICKCFIEFSNAFGDYVTYCTNYQRILSTLASITSMPRVQEALQRRQQLLNHSLPLSSYLLKPVQRILKYHLFIENMLKEIALTGSVSSDEQKIVKKAFDAMTAQASKINDEKKKSEHQERVQQLHMQISRWKSSQTEDLSAYGELLLEASFRLHGSKTCRLLFLFEEMLLVVKQRGTQYVCKDYIMCSNLMLNESITDDPLAFQVLYFDNPRAQYIFLAANMEQKRVWVQELKRMVLDHYDRPIPEETKKLMLSMDHTQPKIPFGRPEFADVSIRAQKKVPKYLEKRRKSVERKEREDSPGKRRRSLSASRMIVSEPSMTSIGENKMSEAEGKGRGMERSLMCSCPHQPGTSNARNVELRSPQPGDGEKPVRQRLYEGKKNNRHLTVYDPPSEHSDYEQAPPPIPQRGWSVLPPVIPARRDISNGSEGRLGTDGRLGNDIIEQTFADLFDSLNMIGTDNRITPVQMNNFHEESAARRLDALVRRLGSQPEASKVRSKSLTRLDQISTSCDHFYAKPLDLPQLKKNRSAAHEQALKVRLRKLPLLSAEEVLPLPPPLQSLAQLEVPIGQMEVPRPLTALDPQLLSPDTDPLEKWQLKREMNRGPAPTPPDRKSGRVHIDRHGRASVGLARQRTALTVEQIQQLDDVLLEPQLGVVREMVRQLERDGGEGGEHRHLISNNGQKSTLFL